MAAKKHVMPPELRQLQKEYTAELLERIMKASCPTCEAKPGQPCIAGRGPYRGREMKRAHWGRHNEAKRLGFVYGHYYKE